MAWSEITNIKGPQGDTGDKGDTGDTGVRGATWFTGAGVPDVVPGSLAGDLYLDTDNGNVYKLA
jgi:hypothetical protein